MTRRLYGIEEWGGHWLSAIGATPYQPGAAPQVTPPKFSQGPSARPMPPTRLAACRENLNGTGFQPLEMFRTGYPGRWPRLVWSRADGPKSHRPQRHRRASYQPMATAIGIAPKKSQQRPTARAMPRPRLAECGENMDGTGLQPLKIFRIRPPRANALGWYGAGSMALKRPISSANGATPYQPMATAIGIAQKNSSRANGPTHALTPFGRMRGKYGWHGPSALENISDPAT
jgi:hypothetical protein